MILLTLAIASLVYTAVILTTHIEEIKNPIGYSLAYHNIPYCSYIEDGEIITIEAINKTIT